MCETECVMQQMNDPDPRSHINFINFAVKVQSNQRANIQAKNSLVANNVRKKM